MPLATCLREGLVRLGLTLTAADQERLLHLLEALGRWNRLYSLTSIREPAAQVAYHLLDSLVAADFVAGEHILDLGTGPGFPGLPLAVAQPARRFVLLDSNDRKLRFARQMQIELALENVQVVHSRVEDYHPERGFDTVIARAFAPLPTLLSLSEPLLAAGGQVLALKGAQAADEVAALDSRWRVTGLVPVAVPGVDAGRHIVTLEPLINQQ